LGELVNHFFLYSFFSFGLGDESPFGLYITSLYWATMTLATVGYGDIRAVNTSTTN